MAFNKKLGDVNVGITGDPKGLKAALNKAKSSVGKFTKYTKEKLSGIGSASKMAATGILAIGAASVGVVKAIAGIGSSFEDSRTALEAFYQDRKKAEAAFSYIKNITRELPTDIEETTDVFKRLTALGITPTEERMKSFANTASASNKSIMQYTEAVADAVTGEFERLKEFSVKTKRVGDDIAFTFQGNTKLIKNDAGEIMSFLESLGTAGGAFDGAATKKMSNLSGEISNIVTGLQSVSDQIYSDGLGTYLTKLARQLGDWVQQLPLAYREWKRFIASNQEGFDAFSWLFKKLFEGLGMLVNGFVNIRSTIAKTGEFFGIIAIELESSLTKAAVAVQHAFEVSASKVQSVYIDAVNAIIDAYNMLPGIDDLQQVKQPEPVKSFDSKMDDVDNSRNEKLIALRIKTEEKLKAIDDARAADQKQLDEENAASQIKFKQELEAQKAEEAKRNEERKRAKEAGSSNKTITLSAKEKAQLQAQNQKSIDDEINANQVRDAQLIEDAEERMLVLQALERDALKRKNEYRQADVKAQLATGKLTQAQAIQIQKNINDAELLLIAEQHEAINELHKQLEKEAEDKRLRDAELQKNQLTNLLEGWQNTADAISGIWASALQGIADNITQLVMTGKANFSDLINSITQMIVQAQVQKMMSDMLSGLPQALGEGAKATGGSGPPQAMTKSINSDILEKSPQMTLNLTVNTTSADGTVDTQAMSKQFDFKKGVQSVVIDDMQNGGNIARQLKGML